MSRQRRIPTPSWEKDRGITRGISGSRLQMLAALGAAALVLAAVAAIGFGFLSNYLEDRDRPNSTALKIGDTEFTVRDFTNRAKIYVAQIGGTSNYQFIIPTVASQLAEQAINIKFADEKSVSVTDDEVKTQIATLLGIEGTDPNFDQRLQEELTKTGLSDEQYRDLARGNVLRTKLNDQFSTELPATIDSVHYRQIVVADQAKADDIKVQIEAGGDFAALALASSTDTTTKDKGGDLGWAPKGFLNASLDDLLFSLDVNQVVTFAGRSSVTIYQVTEKDPAHAIDEEKKGTLANQNYQKWLTEKKDSLTIVDEMDFTTGDVEKIRYVIANAELTAS
jgi:foldase protein PrsA